MKHQLGFPFPAIDPLAFLVDDEIRPFEIDIRHDLTGTGAQACPTIATGQFIVHEHRVPENTAEVIMGVFPHLWARNGIATPSESVVQLTPIQVAGSVLFTLQKDGNQPYIIENNYNKPSTAAAPNDTDREVLSGSTWLPVDAPVINNISMQNPLKTIFLAPGSIFRVVFSLTPDAILTPIPNPWQIGAGTYRIDFAGALVSGVRLPRTVYDQLKVARRAGQLGPEASAATSPPGTR